MMNARVNELRGIALAAPILLAGCGVIPVWSAPQHPYDVYYDDKHIAEHIAAGMKEINSLEVEYYGPKTSEDTRRTDRDHVVSILQTYINFYWRKYRSDFYGNSAATKTAMETTAAALSGAASVTTPASVAKVLAALSASTTMFGTSVDKNLLQNNAVDLLLGQMESDTQVFAERIRRGLTLSTQDYPLVSALGDLDSYAAAMSIPSALASLRAASGKHLNEVKQSIAETAVGTKSFRAATVDATPAGTTQKQPDTPKQ